MSHNARHCGLQFLISDHDYRDCNVVDINSFNHCSGIIPSLSTNLRKLKYNTVWQFNNAVRWAYTLELMNRIGVGVAVCVDSDVLMFSDGDEIASNVIGGATVAATNHLGCWTLGQCVIDLNNARRYCEYMALLDKCEEDSNDMTLFTDYANLHSVNVDDYSVPRSGVAMDHHIAITDRWECEQSRCGFRKRITFNSGKPFAVESTHGNTRLLNIHFWGPHKQEIDEFIERSKQ